MKNENSRQDIEEKLALLAAFLLTDGYIYRKESTWRIGFYSKDISLIEKFNDFVFRIFGKSPKIRKTKRAMVSEISSKEFEVFVKIFKTLSTKNDNEINLQPFYNLTKGTKREILRILYSTEGSISPSFKDFDKLKEVRIIFTSKSEKVRKLVRDLLKEFGINSSCYQDDVVIRKKKDVIIFAREIGFIDGVKIYKSRRFKGMEKNKLLLSLLNLL